MTISPHQPMLRGVRLLNALQQGLTLTEFSAALENPTLAAVVDTLLRRRGASWARSTIDAAAGSLSAAQVAAYLTSGHILSPYITASGVAMSAVASSAEAMAAIASSAEAMAAVLSSGISVSAIFAVSSAKAAIMASTALAATSVPKMTSATTPSGVASESSVYGGYSAYLAFDKSNSTFWAGVAGSPTNQWIQYTFPSDTFVSSVSVLPFAPPHNPINCRIECSNDGINFSIIKTFVMDNSILNTVSLAKAGFYRHWRLFIENVGGPSHPGIYELNFTGFVKP